MKIIVCLDDNNGMLFNNRRQSRDKAVTEDIVSTLQSKKLLISPFSEKLFQDYSEKVSVDAGFLEKAADEDVCFVENEPLNDFKNITELIVYRWNRVYPADFSCDINFSDFAIVSETEFKGNSHDNITKQIFVKR